MAEARYVHIVDEVPELDRLEPGPVLVHSLEGFLDAGNAAGLAAEHLLSGSDPTAGTAGSDPTAGTAGSDPMAGTAGSDPMAAAAGRVVATFEVDAFYDYRARRPPMTFSEDHYEGYETPRLVVRLVHDRLGTPFLLMTGPEPDTHWEAFAQAVRAVVEAFRVRLTVSLGAVPMAVPHTRPVMLTNHATSPGLVVAENLWRGRIRVPASAQALLELRLGEWGHPAMGFVAHIPHYVAQLDYPSAAASLLEAVEVATGLEWDLGDLETAGQAKLVEISAQIADSAEVLEVVTGLEQQYDAFHRAEAQDTSTLPLAEDGQLPSGEELGAEFERFLAGLDRPNDPGE